MTSDRLNAIRQDLDGVILEKIEEDLARPTVSEHIVAVDRSADLA